MIKNWKGNSKRCDPIEISQEITIQKEFLVSDEENENMVDYKYDLYAVVIHSGISASWGHYYTIAKDNIIDPENPSWKSFNDSMISDVDNDFMKTVSEKIKTDTPYILFYKERQTCNRKLRLWEESKDEQIDIKNHFSIPQELKYFIRKTSHSHLTFLPLFLKIKIEFPILNIEKDNEDHEREKKTVLMEYNKKHQ